MFTRAIGIAVSTIMLGCLTGVGTAAAAVPPPLEPECTTFVFDISFGQGVEALCDNAPGVYQVVAWCSDGVQAWSTPGNIAEPGGEPSVVECRGLIFFPAHVVSYFVVQ